MRSNLKYRWLAPQAPAANSIEKLKAELDLPAPILQLLAQRKISDFESAKKFFKPSLDDLYDPWLLKDMDKAVARINAARERQEKIMVYGDYDVDGTTAVALLSSFLNHYHSALITYIPDRYKEGYGVSYAGIDEAERNGVTLIIALDCGIKAVDKVQYAAKKGIDFIICDHHTPGPTLPAAVAVLDPKREDCSYPYKGLSGCGVGFKLAQALCEAWQGKPEHYWDLLDLLALSIGADIVPMTGENRILAFYGLKKINEAPSPGLAALLEIAEAANRQLTISDLVFILAPRINAAGRLDHGRKAVDLLSGSDLSSLNTIAAEIDQRNQERRSLDQEIAAEALALIEEKAAESYSTVVYKPHWHKGVIGIVASRLIESYYRPTIVLTKSGEKWAGSARSVSGFNVYEALLDCEEHLEQFGGHPAAAGMTLKEEKLEDFAAAFEKAVKKRIKEEQRQPSLDIDLLLEPSDIEPKLYRLIQRCGPFGPENMSPVLVMHNLVDAGSRKVGKDGSHLKLSICDPESGLSFDGIGFGMAAHLDWIPQSEAISVAFHLDLNEFRGNVSLQLRVLDIKPSEEAISELKLNRS